MRAERRARRLVALERLLARGDARLPRAPRARRLLAPPPHRRRPPRGGRGHGSSPDTEGRRRPRRRDRARPSRGRAGRRGRRRRRRPFRAPARRGRSRPRPAPTRHSASAIAFPSFSTPTGTPKRSPRWPATSSERSGRFTAPSPTPVLRSRFIGTPTPIAPAPSARALRRACRARRGTPPGRSSGSAPRPCARSCRRARPAREHLRPADVHADDQVGRHDAATIPGLMPAQDKPYRVYRGGRVKGRVPLTRNASPALQEGPPAPSTPGPRPPKRRRRPAAGSRSALVPPARPARRVGDRQLPVRLERRLGGQRPGAGGRRASAHEARRAARLDPDDDPRARHRRR